MGSSIFKRRNITLNGGDNSSGSSDGSLGPLLNSPGLQNPKTVLVINASDRMAKEITMQLVSNVEGCSIMYSPTIALARIILIRHPIDLVVSSPVLPDGGVGQLESVLKKLKSPPDLVVVGSKGMGESATDLSRFGYKPVFIRGFPNEERRQEIDPPQQTCFDEIGSLGANLRNDLNNPIQEIVAMAFVAKTAALSPMTDQALAAIEKAAMNMAKVVNSLEDKIRNVITPLAKNN